MTRGLLSAALLLAITLPTVDGLARDYENPRYGVELKFGPFSPDISDNRLNRDYYEIIFQPSETREDSLFEYRPLMKTFEFDYYLDTQFGLLGILGSAGHWRIQGRARTCPAGVNDVCNENAAPDDPDSVFGKSEAGNSVTTLTIIPLTAGLLYRFDLLKRATPWFPLVPYGKAGLSYTFWTSSTGGSRAKSRDGETSGRGGNMGYFGTLGVGLNLDWIEPSTANRARYQSDIADSYLFIEANLFRADGFDDARLDLSDVFYQAGVSVDFL